MKGRTGLVTIRGNPLTLTGTEARVGDPAPDFEALNNDLGPVKFSSFRGKVCLISSVPSLDTPVCDTETRRFNKDAAGLHQDVEILTISMDLPFAQKRWCGAAHVDRVRTLSDHRDGAFGRAYGVLIQELRLLARAVFVVDRSGILQYQELVKEIGSEPNYEAAYRAIQKLV